MNDKEIIETAKVLLANIADAQKFSNPFNANQLFIISENLLSCLAYLVGPLMDAESAYRGKTAEFMAQGDSASAAEIKSKASEEYKKWKKLDYACELAQEQIMLLKKFADKMEFESKYQR